MDQFQTSGLWPFWFAVRNSPIQSDVTDDGTLRMYVCQFRRSDDTLGSVSTSLATNEADIG